MRSLAPGAVTGQGYSATGRKISLGKDGQVPTEPQAYAIGVPTRFRGLDQRQGMVWRGAGRLGRVEPVPRLRRA